MPFVGPSPTRLGTRLFSTTPRPTHSIYLSTSTNPYFNLSFEDCLFRHKLPHEPLLLLYRDDPCVVIGRNQNPWKEINLPALRRLGIPFVRRRSGGGTVYHDMGNTNFSIHVPRSSFDRHATGSLVERAVRALGIGARLNERNDICVGKHKVSGSAYKIVKDRAYHHGTMLISTRLDTLGDLLHSRNKETMITKGVASVRSPVRNLREFKPEITSDAFVEAVVHEFRESYNVHEPIQVIGEDSMKTVEYIRNGVSELPSWDWAYGQTPEFTYAISHEFGHSHIAANIRSKHGVILSCSFTGEEGLPVVTSKLLKDVSKELEGKRYGFIGDGEFHGRDGEGLKGRVWEWLTKEMEN